MGGLFGGGGQTVPATFSQGGNPAPYVPQAQPGADQNYQALLQGFLGPSLSFLNQGQPFPAVSAYPQAQDLTAQLTNNPYAGQALQGAQVGAGLGQQAADTAFYAGQNTFPFLAGNVTGPVPGLQASGNQILNTAFDPQQALYNQLLNQTQQQAAAQNAMSGLAGTPYGANLANQASTNFNLGWQNNLLGRQAQGIGAANQAFQGAGALEQMGGNLLGQGIGLMSGAPNLYSSTAAMPYNASIGQAQTGMSGLNSLVNLGNQQYVLPQQLMNDLQSYLQLGQAASGLAGQLGNAGFNQGQAGLGNMVGLGALGSQALFGSGGPFGSSGLFGPIGGQGFPDPSLFSDIGTAGTFGFGGAAGGAVDAATAFAADPASALLPFAFL